MISLEILTVHILHNKKNGTSVIFSSCICQKYAFSFIPFMERITERQLLGFLDKLEYFDALFVYKSDIKDIVENFLFRSQTLV